MYGSQHQRPVLYSFNSKFQIELNHKKKESIGSWWNVKLKPGVKFGHSSNWKIQTTSDKQMTSRVRLIIWTVLLACLVWLARVRVVSTQTRHRESSSQKYSDSSHEESSGIIFVLCLFDVVVSFLWVRPSILWWCCKWMEHDHRRIGDAWVAYASVCGSVLGSGIARFVCACALNAWVWSLEWQGLWFGCGRSGSW